MRCAGSPVRVVASPEEVIGHVTGVPLVSCSFMVTLMRGVPFNSPHAPNVFHIRMPPQEVQHLHETNRQHEFLSGVFVADWAAESRGMTASDFHHTPFSDMKPMHRRPVNNHRCCAGCRPSRVASMWLRAARGGLGGAISSEGPQQCVLGSGYGLCRCSPHEGEEWAAPGGRRL